MTPSVHKKFKGHLDKIQALRVKAAKRALAKDSCDIGDI